LRTALRARNYQHLCNQIFAADKRIRYVTVTDSECKVMAVGMRPGVVPLKHTHENAERIDLHVAVLDGVMRTWAETLGRARFALKQHKRAHMLIVPFNDKHPELSIEPSMSIEEIARIIAMIENALRLPLS
jgi:anti-sigma factor ChrR (cupin superfamily)